MITIKLLIAFALGVAVGGLGMFFYLSIKGMGSKGSGIFHNPRDNFFFSSRGSVWNLAGPAGIPFKSHRSPEIRIEIFAKTSPGRPKEKQ